MESTFSTTIKTTNATGGTQGKSVFDEVFEGFAKLGAETFRHSTTLNCWPKKDPWEKDKDFELSSLFSKFNETEVKAKDYHTHIDFEFYIPGAMKETLEVEIGTDAIFVKGTVKSFGAESLKKITHIFPTTSKYDTSKEISATYVDGVVRFTLHKKKEVEKSTPKVTIK